MLDFKTTQTESRDEDASFERQLYKSWITCPGYTEADKKNLRDGLYKDLTLVENQHERALTIEQGVNNTGIKNEQITNVSVF